MTLAEDRTPALSSALDGADRHASVAIVVATPAPGGWTAAFVNARGRALFGRLQRIPEDLRLDSANENAILGWLETGPTDGSLLLEVSPRPAPGSAAFRMIGRRTASSGRPAAVLFFYDATERQEADAARADSEARFRTLLDAAPDALAIGTERDFLYANPALVKLLGYEAMGDVTGRSLAEHIESDDMALVRKVARLVLLDQPQPPFRFRAIRKDGGRVPVEARIIAIDWDGERGMLGIARDLTERRRLQAQLIRADRLAAMGTLAAGVAHEINNPLAYLMLNLQYVMRELPRLEANPAKLPLLLERLAEAEHGARRVSTIVSDLRAFGRPEQVDHCPVSVTRALVSAVKVTSTQTKHRARLEEDYRPVPLVDGSATRLEQVFVNLIVNAAQAIAEGDPDGNAITTSVRREGDRVIVEVADTGSGIPPEIVGRVFDPFFTTKPRGVGTGLGLPISRGIVTSLGGDITVTSVVGKGTTFRVSLPALPREDFASSPEGSWPPAEAVGGTARARILVVDDEPLVVDMLKRALAEAHDVSVATDARTALDHVLSGQDFDLIFCDVLMPSMSGMDLYDELSAQRPGMEARMVFMTGGAFTERAATFLAKISNPKMSKPFDLTELERVVARISRTKA